MNQNYAKICCVRLAKNISGVLQSFSNYSVRAVRWERVHIAAAEACLTPHWPVPFHTLRAGAARTQRGLSNVQVRVTTCSVGAPHKPLCVSVFCGA